MFPSNSAFGSGTVSSEVWHCGLCGQRIFKGYNHECQKSFFKTDEQVWRDEIEKRISEVERQLMEIVNGLHY